MHESWVLSFPEGVSATAGGDGELAIQSPYARLILRHVPAPVQRGLLRLGHSGETVGRLIACVEDSGGQGALARLFYHLQSLAARGYLLITASAEGKPLATLMPTASSFKLPQGAPAAGSWVLSRFACLRREGAVGVLESPLSAARIVLHDHRSAALCSLLMTPTTMAEIGGRVAGLSADASNQLVRLLVGAGMLTAVGPCGTSAEDQNTHLLSWEFHDLLFHARSREGRHDAPLGNTCRFFGRLEVPPAVKAAMSADTVALYRPDLEKLQCDDPPLARVMEQRRSIREYGAEPVTVRQLGEFLYRVARVRAHWMNEIETPCGPSQMDTTSRPTPTGGSLFALELYPVVQACEGLVPGLYHYDPEGHRLERLSEVTAEVAHLLADAGMATGISGDALQVLLVYGARFQRVAWKYSSLAYALILKDAGLLMQNMYLAAEAMSLAPCALGMGNADVFARAIGSDYFDETSVGEFLLGSRR